jgi:hypothetical protein
MPWSRAFEDPIALSDGHQFFTLKQAGDYIMKLPKAEQNLQEWQAATEALIMAAEDRGPLLHARVGMLRALNRHVEREVQSRSERDALGEAEVGKGSVAAGGDNDARRNIRSTQLEGNRVVHQIGPGGKSPS